MTAPPASRLSRPSGHKPRRPKHQARALALADNLAVMKYATTDDGEYLLVVVGTARLLKP